MAEKAYILTFGCQMNVYDSEVLESILAADGCLMVESPEEADLVVVNTCSVRQKAESRAMAHIAQIAGLKKTKPSMKLVVAGCMAKNAGQDIIDKIPPVDYIVGPDYIPEIPEIIRNTESPRVIIDEKNEIPGLASPVKSGAVSAFIAISRGCDNYCSYCIVPYVRGAFRSRSTESIISEMKMMIDLGVKDITLLGQNVNSYCYNNTDFPKLLYQLAPIAPLRLRFLTSHPKDLSDDLIGCFKDIPALCESLHLPLQSGSDKILKAMNRRYDIKHYLSIIEKVRRAIPDITITTDLIVGFPGESKADFELTLKAVREVRFDSAFMFRYSVRLGTKASEFPDDIPDTEKIERLNELIAIQQEISEKRNRRWLNRSLEILIDGFSRRKPILPKGKTRGGQSVLVKEKPELKTGDLIRGKITSTRAKTLFAVFEKVV